MNCRIAERIFEVISLMEEEKKQPKDYGGKVPLYHAEVSFLNEIFSHPGENASAVSARIGITKGAVTQLSGKLVQKGLLTITKRENNQKEKYFQLTPEGEQAVRGYHQFHRESNKRLCNYISTLNEEQTSVIFEFLEQLKQCVPFSEFHCECGNDEKKETNYEQPATAQCVRLERGTGERNKDINRR